MIACRESKARISIDILINGQELCFSTMFLVCKLVYNDTGVNFFKIGKEMKKVIINENY